MVRTIDQAFLSRITIIIIIGIAIVGALIGLKIAGVFGEESTPVVPGPTTTGAAQT